MFERVHLVPGPEAQVPLATNVAANLTAKKRIQGWHVAPDGIGITIDLYSKTSGIASDYKGYDLYRTYIIGEFELVGMEEKVPHRRVVEPGADAAAVEHREPAKPAEAKAAGAEAGSEHRGPHEPRGQHRRRRELSPDSGVESDSRSTEASEEK